MSTSATIVSHAYCLMDNLYHLLIETPDGNFAIGTGQLNGDYTQIVNNPLFLAIF